MDGDSGPIMVGLIAGSGSLPLKVAERLRDDPDRRVVAAAFQDEADPAIDGLAEGVEWVHLGQFKKIFDFFTARNVRWVVMCGGVNKPSMWKLRPDALAMKLLLTVGLKHDDNLLRGITRMWEERGFEVKGAAEFLPSLLVEPGTLSKRPPTAEQWEEIRFGWRMAKEVGRLGIGQGVVVRDRTVVAVEAIEGTDAMIARAGAFTGGEGVMVKVVKPGQDRRLDLPTIGSRTVENMHKAGIVALALEAGGAQILDLPETVAVADRFGVAVVALEEGGAELQPPGD